MIHPSLFLRRVLQADAVFSGVAALLFVFGAGLLASLTHLPEAFLREVGFTLVLYAALVGYLGTRGIISAAAVKAVIAVNAAWAIASIALLLSGWGSPNLFGQALIVMQTIAVGVFAELQFIGLRRSAGERNAH